MCSAIDGVQKMAMNRASQQLRRELLDMEKRCDDATVVIWNESKFLPGTSSITLMKAIALLHQNMDHLQSMADHVKSGVVVAEKSLKAK